MIAFPSEIASAETMIKAFLKQHMYRHARVMRVMDDAEAIVTELFAHYRDCPNDLPPEWLPAGGAGGEGDSARLRRICNFIAGMTDRFALTEHQRLFDSTAKLR
jgi:dGTPase